MSKNVFPNGDFNDSFEDVINDDNIDPTLNEYEKDKAEKDTKSSNDKYYENKDNDTKTEKNTNTNTKTETKENSNSNNLKENIKNTIANTKHKSAVIFGSLFARNLPTINYRELAKQNTEENPREFKNTELEKVLGENYTETYKSCPEKILIIATALRYSKKDDNIDLSQFNPDYSTQKLAAIFDGPKNGYDTSMYKNLNEEQINQIMAAQSEGFNKDEINKIGDKDVSADIMKRNRHKIESEKGIINTVEITFDNFNNTFDKKTYSLNDIINEKKEEMKKENVNKNNVSKHDDLIK
jgi:hypothetical protein